MQQVELCEYEVYIVNSRAVKMRSSQKTTKDKRFICVSRCVNMLSTHRCKDQRGFRGPDVEKAGTGVPRRTG